MERFDMLGEYDGNLYTCPDGDWVKFEDANNIIYDLERKIEKLIKALDQIHNIVDLNT